MTRFNFACSNCAFYHRNAIWARKDRFPDHRGVIKNSSFGWGWGGGVGLLRGWDISLFKEMEEFPRKKPSGPTLARSGIAKM